MLAGDPIEDIAGNPAFRRLATVAGIRVDLRYASAHNFVGRDLYSPFDCAWLHCDAAAGLERAVAWLAQERPGSCLLVLDALRPQRVQESLWKFLADTDLQMYLAEPERGSLHSFGMALDVTIVGEDGAELDMGSAFDDLTELSHPVLEALMLVEGHINPAQIANRKLLRAAMGQAGFVGINSEWWHFDFGDREQVRRTYRRVL